MVHLQMEQLLIDCLLPGMSMVPALTALANEVWGAVNLLDCTDRWRIYTAWRVLPSHIAYKVGDLIRLCVAFLQCMPVAGSPFMFG